MAFNGEHSAAEIVANDVPPKSSAPRVAASPAIDIVVRWGDWVMAARELSPPRSFVVGEQDCDVTLPAEILGAPRVPVLLARWDGDVRLVIPKGARALLGGQKKRMSAARCIARGIGQPSSTVRDAAEVPLLPGQTATLFFQSVAIDLQFSSAAPRTARTPLVEKRLALAQLGSLFVHAVLLGMLFFFVGPAELHEDYGLSADQLYELQKRLWRLEEKEQELQWELDAYEYRARRNQRRNQASIAASQDAWMKALEEGSNRWTAELAAEARRDEATGGPDSSIMGALYDWPEPRATTKPAVAAPTRDSRPMSVTLPPETRRSSGRGPQVRMGAVSVSGRLPPEVIQRIVRQNFGRFRLCYEAGLRNNPNLQGRVAVRFVIGRDGAISNVSNGGSDLPDSGVVSCIVRAYYGLSFPQPEGGIVTVVYPIMLSPGD
jgi:hypothetical protein